MTETIKQTALNSSYRELQAKLTVFAGWEMPLYYGSQIGEHNFVRKDAGMFDVSHMNVVDIKGKNARNFLHYLIDNDIDKIKIAGGAIYGCMLNENGGVIDDLIVYQLTPTYYHMVINAATHDKDLAWIKQQAKKFAVEIIERTDLAMIAIQGPNAIAKTQSIFTDAQRQASEDLQNFQGVDVNGWWISRTGYTGEDGYEIMLPKSEARMFWQKLIEAGVHPCGLVARDSLRLEAGMRLYGSDMDENVTPFEAGLAWTVALEPKSRNFIGRKALEQQKAKGLTRTTVGLVLEDKGVLRNHQKVILPNLGEGEITSGGFSPTLNYSIALARVPVGAKIGDTCFVVVRDKQLKARITKSAFVKRGKKIC